MNSYFKISCKDIENYNQINKIIHEYINKKLKEGSNMTRNQKLLDNDTDYRDRWHELIIKIDKLNISTEEKFDIAYSIQRIIDKAMTISSNHTEVDSTAWLRSNY